MKIKVDDYRNPNPSSAEQREERLRGESPDEPADGELHGQPVHEVPKSFKRTDAEIRHDVEQRLSERIETAAESISVEVENGRVRLDGNVSQDVSREVAERVAARVLGCEDVENRLAVFSRPS